MNTLAVVIDRPEHLQLSHLHLPIMEDEDVVVEVEWSGISTGTERLIWNGQMPMFPGMGYPLVPGYEAVGRVIAVGAVVAFVVYQLRLLATEGQTLGKRFLKLRIVDADTGTNPGFWRAVGIRSFANALIGGFVPLYGLVDALFIFRTDRKCIHDHLAKTVVVTEAGLS